jgi:hypothetical protein
MNGRCWRSNGPSRPYCHGWQRMRAMLGFLSTPCHHVRASGGACTRLYPLTPSLMRQHAATMTKRLRVHATFACDSGRRWSVPSRRLRSPRMDTRSWHGLSPRTVLPGGLVALCGLAAPEWPGQREGLERVSPGLLCLGHRRRARPCSCSGTGRRTTVPHHPGGGGEQHHHDGEAHRDRL